MRIKEFLTERGFTEIHVLGHSRFSKDLNFQTLKFDALALYQDKIALLQFKTNHNQSKKSIQEYADFSKKYNCFALWLNAIDHGGVECHQLN